MLNDDIYTIGQESPALLIQKLHINMELDINRRAISYVFNAIQSGYQNSAQSIAVARRNTFDYLFENLANRSHVFEQFVDISFPDHDEMRRGALSMAMICDETLKAYSLHDKNAPELDQFDEEMVELAVIFLEESLDLATTGGKNLSAGYEPESLFLAYINADDALDVIIADHTQADPRLLRDLEETFFRPLRSILTTDEAIGRYLMDKMDIAHTALARHLAPCKMGDWYILPDNDNDLRM